MPFFAALLAALRMLNVATLLAAATSDVRRRVIPNVLAATVLGAGICLRLLSDPRAFWASMIVGILLYVALAGLVHIEVLGGGDAKLGAASSFLVPVGEVPALLVDIALAGGVLSVICFLARRLSIATDPSVPYGVAIVAGSTYHVLTGLAACSGATSCWS